MTKAIVMHSTGGTDVLSWEECDPGTPQGGEYPLADAARAHRDREERKTSGSSILIP